MIRSAARAMPNDPPSTPEPLAPRGESGVAWMRALLDRPLGPEELAANTALVAARPAGEAQRTRGVLLFRIGAERLGLEAESAHRVVRSSPVRRVPHRSNAVFEGLANIAGELTPVASLAAALGMETGGLEGGGARTHFVVIGPPAARWGFAVDSVEGVRSIDAARTLPAPATVRHAADGCTKFLAAVGESGRESTVAVLDADRVAALLARRLG